MSRVSEFSKNPSPPPRIRLLRYFKKCSIGPLVQLTTPKSTKGDRPFVLEHEPSSCRLRHRAVSRLTPSAWLGWFRASSLALVASGMGTVWLSTCHHPALLTCLAQASTPAQGFQLGSGSLQEEYCLTQYKLASRSFDRRRSAHYTWVRLARTLSLSLTFRHGSVG